MSKAGNLATQLLLLPPLLVTRLALPISSTF
jgi:hypothetical protein